MERMGINHRLSTPYHPETNGLVERFNKTLCQALAKLGENDWDLHIPSVLYAYRTKRNKSTKMKKKKFKNSIFITCAHLMLNNNFFLVFDFSNFKKKEKNI